MKKFIIAAALIGSMVLGSAGAMIDGGRDSDYVPNPTITVYQNPTAWYATTPVDALVNQYGSPTAPQPDGWSYTTNQYFTWSNGVSAVVSGSTTTVYAPAGTSPQIPPGDRK